MKKMMSQAGLAAVAIAVLMSSCVSKRKYMDAQATIEKYRSDSAQLAGQMSSIQQNVSTLEQRNKSLQQQWDSFTESMENTATTVAILSDLLRSAENKH